MPIISIMRVAPIETLAKGCMLIFCLLSPDFSKSKQDNKINLSYRESKRTMEKSGICVECANV
jgi:hypothetical protein